MALKGTGKIPTCHPDRKHAGLGLCQACYIQAYRTDQRGGPARQYGRAAECHPERPHKANGLCLECYKKSPAMKAYDTSYRAENSRRDRLKHHYDLTIEQYDQMLAKQNGVCAICKVEKPRKNRLSVDHNHATEAVRGLLCVPCNRALGYLENPDWRSQADTYLLAHQEPEESALHQPHG